MGFYAVIPFNILVDETLKPNEIKLYGIISALSNTNGYCFATNNALAQYFKREGKDPAVNTVSQWVTSLEERGYVRRVLIYGEDKKTVIERKIFLCVKVSEEISKPTQYEHEALEVLNFLNEVTGKKLAAGLEVIRGRLRDGKSVEDCKKVIIAKSHDSFFQKNNKRYMTPKTLFRKSNFDNYLSEWVNFMGIGNNVNQETAAKNIVLTEVKY